MTYKEEPQIKISLGRRVWGAATSKSSAFLLAIASAAFAVYSWYYHPHPSLTFDVLTDTPVLDIRAPVSKLDITYDGQNLKSSNQELRVFMVKLWNRGVVDVTRDAFDPGDPVGLRLLHGQLLESAVFSGSSDYLNRIAKITQTDRQTVLLTPVILDAGEWIQVRLVTVSRSGDRPTIEPLGKVAGVKSFDFINSQEGTSTASVWQRLVGTNSIWIQLGRGPVYFLFFILELSALAIVVTFVGMPLDSVIGTIRASGPKKRRRAIMREYGKTKAFSPADHMVVDAYWWFGNDVIVVFDNYLGRVERFNKHKAMEAEMESQLSPRFEPATIDRYITWATKKRITPSEEEDLYGPWRPGVSQVERAMERADSRQTPMGKSTSTLSFFELSRISSVFCARIISRPLKQGLLKLS